MTRTDFSDEILMRFADGELDADTAAEVERAMETDDELVARVALFIETRQAARTAMKPLLDEPLPAELKAAVESMVAEKTSAQAAAATVLPFPLRAANDRRANRWLTPVAASLAAVIAGFGGYWLRGSAEPAPEGGLRVAAIGSPALGEALATVAAGEERQLPGSDQRFRAIATFRDNAQALCREFELDSADRSTVVSVACRNGTEWRVTFAVVAPGSSGGYAPASSTETLDAYLAAIDAGAPLEAAQEAKALKELQGGQW
ncbi:anti-sigma factor family protein [Sinorhizobium medicae]|uniref:Putative transmembrane anti-sigma factor n=1 Tax=Sinorhizobium medicae TaxID=110321 RepID=A0A508XAM3_9HYPH|nr:anti-sigma factor [Sinorhizobium medicae]MDX0694410.1 anti-sigma factor [Sinorhizobium medicae]MDX0743593.1 anti-sigma factor [Sinorhizobium medicae]MDX0769770.1 anti-sigma factor [Sinorhizobium medicae]VTZ65128.1 putative transmembrane anti-sigma factor [Sinorhizobium medicae]